MDKVDLIFTLGKICKSTSNNTVGHTNTRPFHLHKGMQRKSVLQFHALQDVQDFGPLQDVQDFGPAEKHSTSLSLSTVYLGFAANADSKSPNEDSSWI